MRKIDGIPVKSATGKGGKQNELHVHSSMNPPKWDVEIKGESESLVKNWHDLSPKTEVNKAIITLSFDRRQGEYQEDSEDDIVYRFVNPDYHTIDEMEKMETEALIDFIINQANGLLEQPLNYQNNLEVRLKKVNDKIDLEVSQTKKGDQKILIKNQNIKFKGRFYRKGAVELWQVRPPQSPQIPWWKKTSGKIIIWSLVGLIILLGVIFRRRIWSLIKRDKKKSRETITF